VLFSSFINQVFGVVLYATWSVTDETALLEYCYFDSRSDLSPSGGGGHSSSAATNNHDFDQLKTSIKENGSFATLFSRNITD
jgi:hypothetical protein